MAGLVRILFFLAGLSGCAISAILAIGAWFGPLKDQPGAAIVITIILGIFFLVSSWVMRKGFAFCQSQWGKVAGSSAYQSAMARIETVTQEARDRAERKQEILRKVTSRSSGSRILKVVAQGGNGWQALSGKTLLLSFDVNTVFLNDVDCDEEFSIPLSDVRDVSIGGPGTVVTGGGAIGGGTGVEGFIAGAAAAAVLNLLTTHKSTKTLVRINTATSELFLLVSTYDPDEMRRYLSPVYTRINHQNQQELKQPAKTSVVDELLKLDQLRVSGVLSPEEFDTLKARILHL
jgi:hypothetical protein